MRVAVQGCAHGKLDAIYSRINQQWKNQVDLLLLCGDVQTMRNQSDLQSLACPPKYRSMGDFYDYYMGRKHAPVLTIFIGGNHEASTYLRELYYGGWVAPNIYYLGFAGVVVVNGLRIAGLSGIYKPHHFHWGHSEIPPFDESTCRSVYHVRQEDVWKLSWLESSPDIMLSHDWPQGVEKHGSLEALLRRKPFFKKEIAEGTLGSPAGRELLYKLCPKRWFSAHLHVKYSATVSHQNGTQTEFLALDKCLPGRQFLELIDIPSSDPENGEVVLKYDPEWLKIIKTFHHLFPTDRSKRSYPNFVDAKRMLNESTFQLDEESLTIRPLPLWPNDQAGIQQTNTFCQLLGITNPNDCMTKSAQINPDEIQFSDSDIDACAPAPVQNPDEIQFSDSDLESSNVPPVRAQNPDEIVFDDE